MTDTSETERESTRDLFGLGTPPRSTATKRAAGLSGLINPPAQRTQEPPPAPMPDFSALPTEAGERLYVLEAILRAAETEYSGTLRAARNRFLLSGGIALHTINKEDLWQQATDADGNPYPSFLAYATKVWGYEKSNVYLLLDSVKVHEDVPGIDDYLNTGLVKAIAPALRTHGPALGPVWSRDLRCPRFARGGGTGIERWGVATSTF